MCIFITRVQWTEVSELRRLNFIEGWADPLHEILNTPLAIRITAWRRLQHLHSVFVTGAAAHREILEIPRTDTGHHAEPANTRTCTAQRLLVAG